MCVVSSIVMELIGDRFLQCEMEKQIKDLMKGLHECAVYSGINNLKGIGKGQVGLFVLS